MTCRLYNRSLKSLHTSARLFDVRYLGRNGQFKDGLVISRPFRDRLMYKFNF